MLTTSALYKTLFNAGAIQEYKIEIDGVSYTGDVIYDTPTLTQTLFDKSTLTVGSFAVSQFKAKLRVPTNDIPRNADVKFSYRYTDGIDTSEWIQKFDGRVSKRTEFSPEITTIEARDRGANYDVFLDYFASAIVEYPANVQIVTELCAGHLGLVVDNIGDVINQNIVEYPNEMTVVEVLKNIAAASGGNWTITENNRLRLIVGSGYNVVGTYPATSTEGFSLLSPITKVTMARDDEVSFERGDDTGSEIIIDCPWATQATTNHVFDIFDGYEYKPSKSTKVYADPAIQLGDTILCGDTVQLVADITWTFSGSCVADIEAPQNNDTNLDDPYNILVQNQFKRKVTLGNPYHGVTIGGQDGIQMLYSPDGTSENATGRWYADLTKGMAMQWRDTPTDDWQDWLYFDKNEEIFKLSLYNTSEETDAKIELSVRDINNINIIANNVGTDGVKNWSFVSQAIEFTTPSAEFNSQWEFVSPTGAIARTVTTTTIAETGFEIWGRGSMISDKARIIHPADRYCLRVFTKGAGKLVFKVRELDANDNLLKTTTLSTINSSVAWTQYDSEFVPLSNTENVQLEIVSTVNPYLANPEMSQFSDLMLVRNIYKNYEVNAQDVMDYVRAEIAVMANEISLKVSTNEVISAINLSTEGVKIQAPKIQLEGVVTANSYFKILEDGSMEAVNGTFTGTITSDTGKIGDFNINSLGLTKSWTGTTKTFTNSDYTRVGDIASGNITPTQNDYNLYDVNQDGKIDAVDYVMIANAISGRTSNPIVFTYTATIKPNDSLNVFTVRQALSDGTEVSLATMGSSRVKSSMGDFANIYLGNRQLTVDSNGFVKAK